MIVVTCHDCRHEFEVPAIRAGVYVLCPPCGSRVLVPRQCEDEQEQELVGAHASEQVRTVRGDSRHGAAAGAAASGLWEPAMEHGAEIEWDRPDDDVVYDATRNFEPLVEDELRRGHLFRIGLALTLAFLAPIVGAPGSFVMFPQFSEFPGMNLAGLILLLPLIAGIVLMVVAKHSDVPARGVVTVAAGAALFGVMLLDRGARSLIGQSLSVIPTSLTLSSALLVVGAFGLLISTRARWYRPTSRIAYVIGAVAAGCYILYLFLPVNGSMPIADPLQMFRMHKLMGIGLFAHVGLMAAAALLCAGNLPKTLASRASTKSGHAFLCLIGAVVVPAVAMAFSAMSMASSMSMPGMDVGSPAALLISSVLKFGVMYGGLALLVPVGIADIVVGRL